MCAPQFFELFGDFVILRVSSPRFSIFASQPFRYVTIVGQPAENGMSMARFLGNRPSRPIGFDRRLCRASGFVFLLVRNLIVSRHSLRVRAIALGENSSLQVQISTVRAVPLGLPSKQHMTCGTTILTIRYVWRASPTPWCCTTFCCLLPSRRAHHCSTRRLPCHHLLEYDVALAHRMDPHLLRARCH